MDQNGPPKHTVIALWKHYEGCFATLVFLRSTHLFLKKMSASLQMTLVWMFIYCFKFHSCLFLMAQWTFIHHLFRYRLCTNQATGHSLSQWWPNGPNHIWVIHRPQYIQFDCPLSQWSRNQSSCRFLFRRHWLPSGKLTTSQWVTSKLKLLLSISWFGKHPLLWRVDYLASSPLLCNHPRPSFNSVNSEAPNSFVLFAASRFSALRKPSQRIFGLYFWRMEITFTVLMQKCFLSYKKYFADPLSYRHTTPCL